MGVGVTRFSVSIDPELLEEFDGITNEHGYNRSTAVQVSMRDFLSKHRWTEGVGDMAGAITFIYDPRVRGLSEAIFELVHMYSEQISASTQVYITQENHLEILAVKGNAKEIKELARNISVVRGVQQLKVAILET
ncbi:MAG: CopG family ribbon-helix-helix protein [Candidatus Bathyarchaeota archaeon]|nr:CopG family ribbon-helix-helix protein [Candidatus Bathyarchaeota archaeon]